MTRKTTKNNDSLLGMVFLVALLLLFNWAVKNQEIALALTQQPELILPYLVEQFGLLRLIFTSIIIIGLLWLLIRITGDKNANVLRGAKIVSSRKLRRILKRQPKLKHQPQLEIAGMPIPAKYENRGFFLIGSPGSGKTQAISQMVAVLKQRPDFRGIVFDRGGELLEKFYDPSKDLIFNPFDARSCYWTHMDEPTRTETIAAGLIPMGLSKEPFFATAGRAVMSELFRKTQSNEELFELLQGRIEILSSFLSGTLAARYLEEPKAATSVLSTVANYCQFYSALIKPQGETLSFYRWGESESPRWIFVTLRENDADLLKPLYSLVFELMLKGLISNEERNRKTAIVIDELGALNQLPSLDRLLSESRKYLGCPILGTQTEAQITKIYGQEDTRIILQGTKTKLVLNCADPQTAETMAKIIGKQESVHVMSNRSRTNHRGGQNRTMSENEQIKESFAVLPAELQDLPDLRGYLKIAGFPAGRVRVKVNKFQNRTKRFVAYSNKQEKTIKQQWQKFVP